MFLFVDSSYVGRLCRPNAKLRSGDVLHNGCGGGQDNSTWNNNIGGGGRNVCSTIVRVYALRLRLSEAGIELDDFPGSSFFSTSLPASLYFFVPSFYGNTILLARQWSWNYCMLLFVVAVFFSSYNSQMGEALSCQVLNGYALAMISLHKNFPSSGDSAKIVWTEILRQRSFYAVFPFSLKLHFFFALSHFFGFYSTIYGR